MQIIMLGEIYVHNILGKQIIENSENFLSSSYFVYLQQIYNESMVEEKVLFGL